MDTEKLIQDVVKSVMQKLSSGIAPDSSVKSNSDSKAANGKLEMAKSTGAGKKVVCSISVKHVHLCREHLDILYGKGYEPIILKELYQPGNYAYKETVTVVGPKLNALQNVRILGPLRSKSQVELAKTDCIILGIDAPVRPSGKLEGTTSCVLIGPKGAVYLNEGVIRANRHLHLSLEDANYFAIKDNDEVDVRVQGPKGLTFNNVQIRVSKDFVTEMHIDTDDGNAADVVNGTLVEIVNASCVSPIGPATVADLNLIPPSIPDSSISGEITDPNILKNMNEAMEVQSALKAKEPKGPGAINIGTAKTTKTLITVADLDNYKISGINLSANVILSPLAKDEAIVRGIKISG